MNRRLLSIPATALSAALLLAACGGSSATTAPAGAPTPGGVVTPTPAAAATSAVLPTSGVPTVAPATVAASTLAPATGAEPTDVPGDTAAPATVVPDNDLAAKFPTSIDGQPVENVQTGLFASSLQGFNIPDATLNQIAQQFSSIGIDLATLSSGTADYTVDGESVTLQAVRTPNNDANKFLQGYSVIIGTLDSVFGESPPPPPTMVQSNIGGRNVTVATDSDGNVTTLYVTGDTVFIVQNMTDSQTAKVIAALP